MSTRKPAAKMRAPRNNRDTHFMTRPATAFLALLLLAAPLAATAQQTATEEVAKPATEEAAEAAPSAETQPKAAMEPVEALASGEVREVVKETHGDWDIVCAADGSACIMAQKGVDADGREIMEVRIRRIKEQDRNKVKIVAAIQIAVPIGVILPAGVTLQIDTAKPLPAGYRTCNPTACLVQEAVDDGLINAMKMGAKATFTLVAPPNIKVPVAISLKGFTAAFNALKQ
jgi:invasion protein IalB